MLTLNDNQMTNSNPGITFQGWTTAQGSTNVEYSDGATITSHLGTDGQTITLYAVWA